jgi:hypothetical protein
VSGIAATYKLPVILAFFSKTSGCGHRQSLQSLKDAMGFSLYRKCNIRMTITKQIAIKLCLMTGHSRLGVTLAGSVW